MLFLQTQHSFHQHCIFIPYKLRFITGLNFPLCMGFIPSVRFLMVEVLLPKVGICLFASLCPPPPPAFISD